MKPTIRVLGLATLFLGIFFTAFLVSVVYSAMNYRMSLGEPAFFSHDNIVGISIPVIVNNTGYHDVTNLNFATLVLMSNGEIVTQASTFVPLIKHGQSIVAYHNVSININELISGNSKLLFEDANFTLRHLFSLNFGKVIPFSLVTNESLPWGAPFYNFSIGEISPSTSSTDPARVSVPISFENHSTFFNVTGTLRIALFNDRGELFGERVTNLDVATNSAYNSIVEIIGGIARFTRKGQLHVYFETSMFSYGPLVINYET